MALFICKNIKVKEYRNIHYPCICFAPGIEEEEKAKVIGAALGTDLIQFLAAPAISHQDGFKILMNCTKTI